LEQKGHETTARFENLKKLRRKKIQKGRFAEVVEGVVNLHPCEGGKQKKRRKDTLLPDLHRRKARKSRKIKKNPIDDGIVCYLGAVREERREPEEKTGNKGKKERGVSANSRRTGGIGGGGWENEGVEEERAFWIPQKWAWT